MSYAPVRVAVVGNVDSGKSTMIGVMTSGELDDGRGKMRCSVATHSHEIDSGRTSTIATELLGFDEARAPVFAASHHGTTAKSGLTKSSKKGKWKEYVDIVSHAHIKSTCSAGQRGPSCPSYALSTHVVFSVCVFLFSHAHSSLLFSRRPVHTHTG